jgi:hypothetical protein
MPPAIAAAAGNRLHKGFVQLRGVNKDAPLIAVHFLPKRAALHGSISKYSYLKSNGFPSISVHLHFD